MARKKLFWQFYILYIFVTAAILIALGIYSSRLFARFYISETKSDLSSKTALISPTIGRMLAQSDFEKIDQLCKEIGPESQTRITVILPDGKVVGDSEEMPHIMACHADRPEIVQAKAGKTGSESRYSETLGKMMMYVASPLKDNNQTVAIIRTSKPLTAIDSRLKEIYSQIASYGLIVAVLAAIISIWISRKITQPIQNMKIGAENFARGNFNHSLEIPAAEELAGLAIGMNKMAGELDKRIRDITTQKNETQAILSSMVEGVIAVDSNLQILSVNQAACELLQIVPEETRGRNIEEAIRNIELQDFLKKALHTSEHVDTEMKISEGKVRYLHAYGKSMTDANTNDIGAIIVLNDITLLRQLEKIRSEFVANVSHELKTPITSIKGFVETLLDGAIEKPDQAKRFLSIIERQTNRLSAIIDDLLILSRLEDQSQKQEIELKPANIQKAIQSAVEICDLKAKEKNIALKLDCTELEINHNDFLLEQAIVNLISNAIKYSDNDKTVTIQSRKEDDYAVISITDQGYGIAKEHIERIFERFYVSDKARSRHLGGTGLGLSIVKHIAQLHHGYVTVQSEPGKGSTFKIFLPAQA